MLRMRLIIVLAVVVGAFAALAPSASAASLGRFINEGLGNNASTATNRTKQLVEVNPKVASAIAKDMGVSPSDVDWNTAKAVNHATCKGYNTGQGANGSVHTTSYGTFACWKFKVNVNGSSRTFNMKDNCSNPLLKYKHAPRPHARVIKKTMTFKVKKPFVLRVQHVCPSGQQVTVTVSGTVRATVKGRVWGKIWGAYTLKFKQQVKIAIDGKIAVECQGTPPPLPHDACVNIEGNQNSIPNGMILVAGNCVTQQITCGTGWYWSDVYLNCIQVVCGVVIVGDGNNVNIGDICSTSPPPPTCPDGRPVPPEGCDRPPLIEVLKPAHMFPGGDTYTYARAHDPDGDQMVVTITATGAGVSSYGSTVEWPSYYDGLTDSWAPCPTGWKCYRARLFASNTSGAIATVTGTVQAGGKTATSINTTFPILQEQGF